MGQKNRKKKIFFKNNKNAKHTRLKHITVSQKVEQIHHSVNWRNI